jgi:hypothetical protein
VRKIRQVPLMKLDAPREYPRSSDHLHPWQHACCRFERGPRAMRILFVVTIVLLVTMAGASLFDASLEFGVVRIGAAQ